MSRAVIRNDLALVHTADHPGVSVPLEAPYILLQR